MITILVLLSIATLLFLFRKRALLIFDSIRLRGNYGVPSRMSLEGLEDKREKFEIEDVRVAPQGIEALVETHGEDIRKYLKGLPVMMRAKISTASVYFTVADRELRVLSVSGDLDDIVDAIQRVAYDLGEEKISQVRVCCASNPALRKALIKTAGAVKTGSPSELLFR